MTTSPAWATATAAAIAPAAALAAGAPPPWPGDLVRVRRDPGLSLLVLPSRLRLASRAEPGRGWRLTRSVARADGSATIRIQRCADEAGAVAALTDALIAHAREEVSARLLTAGAALSRWQDERSRRGAGRLAIDLAVEALADAAYSAAFALDVVRAHAAARQLRVARSACPPWLDEARDDLRRGIDRQAALQRAVGLLPRARPGR